jgi:hypothetical protein
LIILAALAGALASLVFVLAWVARESRKHAQFWEARYFHLLNGVDELERKLDRAMDSVVRVIK